MSVYAHRKNSYSSPYPVLVLEQALWTEGGNSAQRTLRRAEKGARAGRSSSWSNHRVTGIPVLTMQTSAERFRASAEEDYRIVESPRELLVQAVEKSGIMELVDSGESVFGQDPQGRTYRKTRTSVSAHLVNGEEYEIDVELELVRPQSIESDWDTYLVEAEKAALAKAERDKDQADARAENDAVAQNIAARLDALIDNETGYNIRGERYDAHRQHSSSGISTTYEIKQSVLLKLLALAEKGADQ